MPRLAKQQGLTLIELLVTVTIAIILLTMAIPTFRQLYIEYRLSTAAQKLAYTLQYARSEAIKNNTIVYASFVTGSSWCYGLNVSASCTCTTANSCGLSAASGPAAHDISLSVTGMSSNSIHFDGTQGATYSTSTITFALGSTSITVKVGALGNTQLCSSTISGYASCS